MKKTYCLLAGMLFLCLAMNTYAQSVIRGPYLQLSTPSSMTIRWRTDTPTSSRVYYGTSPSNLAFNTTVNGDRTEHEVTISGLPSNSTFYYSVGNTSGQFTAADVDHYFRTAPAPGSTDPISIWVLGDAGHDTDEQRSVRDAFYAFNGSHHADVILALGDNAYSDGTDEEYQYAWFENMFEESLINSVLWPCPGNHDIRSANSVDESGVYYDIFTLPRNGEAGGVPSGTEAYYSFNYGNIHFVSLNSEDIDHSLASPMLSWLEQDLAANTQPWVVAILHRVIYHSQALDDFRHNFVPVLEAGGADLVMYGHQHSYRRSYLINGHYGDGNGSFDPATMAIDDGDGRTDGDGAYQKPGTLTPNAGTIYMVTGSAGTVSALPSSIPFMPYEAGDPEGLGSVHISVFGGQMDVTFINHEMQVLDYFSISKEPVVGTPPSVSVTAPLNGANFTSPQAITITADASDSDGTVSQVEFFVNNASVGIDGQAPYAVNYTIPGNGTYNVVASASDNDGNTTPSSAIQFTVGPVITCSRIDASSDDGEERPSGSITLTSGDLELVDDGTQGSQVVGMRFNGLNVPQGANIANAYIQFTVDENTNDNPCSLTITGEASDNAATFDDIQGFNISSRPRTNASVSWSPSDWLSVGDAGSAQQTPSLVSIIQEIVNRPGYSANSSIALFIEGMGRRTAESFDGAPSSAPELCIEYSTAAINFDCPNIPANIGAPCDDGDNTTLNDQIDSNCNCTGMPTACTGIGDADGDGICADVDCDDMDASIAHQPGDACDDGNPATINDVYDSNCNCQGTFNDCSGIGDMDGDGICSDVDCDDTDPNNTSRPGDSCDDGNTTTVDDVLDANCNCVGTPTGCTGIGDADGDGVCSDMDCDDNDPNNTTKPGDPCDDGNPNTSGETIQADCSCGGGLANTDFSCVQVNNSADDAEEEASGAVSLTSSDLELTEDAGPQTVGMRFTGLNIPQGATILNAYIQFTTDENGNTNPCNLTIYGEAADDAQPFSDIDFNISSRQRTAASVGWIPPDWLSIGDAGPGQQTPDLSSLLQEIVNRSGYTSNSAIVLLIEGSGKRVAESSDGNVGGPQLCVAFSTSQYDCPSLSANIGDPCDDGDNTTTNDMVDANCNCTGTPTLCTGIGDADGDGICADVDCDDSNASITTLDADGDGACSDIDCNDTDANEFPGQTWFLDADGDGYGAGSSQVACTRPASHYTAAELTQTSGDCDDSNAAVNPGAAEACNGLDDNCNDQTDENITNQDYYFDADGDGYGSGTPVNDCQPPGADYVLLNGDCDDSNPAVNPGAAEACNGVDDNCNTQIDEGVQTIYYADNDNDGFGDPASATQACSAPAGYVTDNTDCNDNDANEFPGQTWFLDADGDGYSTGSSQVACTRPASHYTAAELTQTSGDCDDSNTNINPGAQEVCDGIDNDCQTDEGVQSITTSTPTATGTEVDLRSTTASRPVPDMSPTTLTVTIQRRQRVQARLKPGNSTPTATGTVPALDR
ncbi:MAG: metallophosphoesterase [Lewinellaceae bacterium]|nr:metallophosphoesterase [Lewinellaceae bacterium]